jgi:hypothetical protein
MWGIGKPFVSDFARAGERAAAKTQRVPGMRFGCQHVLEAPTAMIARAMSSEALDLDRNGTATSANNALRGHVGDVDYRSRDGRDRYAQQPLAALEAAQLRHDSSRTVGRQHSSRTANLHALRNTRARTLATSCPAAIVTSLPALPLSLRRWSVCRACSRCLISVPTA